MNQSMIKQMTRSSLLFVEPVIVFLLLLLSPIHVLADELKPILIEATQQDHTRWQIKITQTSNVSKSTASREFSLNIQGCSEASDWTVRELDNWVRKVGWLTCSENQSTWNVALEGLENTRTDALFVVKNDKNQRSTVLFTARSPQNTIKIAQNRAKNTFFSYLRLGFEHILAGYDHLLFVFCLVLLIANFKILVAAITAFTVSHSITLAANTFGLLYLNPRAVEAIIALSIVFLARELIVVKPDSLTRQKPWLVALLFGFVHGFGFAGALSEIGLPDGQIPLALFSFNLGVELGQLLVVFIAVAILFAIRQISLFKRRSSLTQITFAYPIGIISMIWLLQRL